MEGHADYAEHGHDIVCASVSVLTQVIGNVIGAHAQTHVIAESGYMRLEIENPNHNTNILAFALRKGLEEIALQYPKHVLIKV